MIMENKINIESLYKEFKSKRNNRVLRDIDLHGNFFNLVGISSAISTPASAGIPGALPVMTGFTGLALGAGAISKKYADTLLKIHDLLYDTRKDFIYLLSKKNGITPDELLTANQNNLSLYELFEKAIEKHADMTRMKSLSATEVDRIKTDHEAFLASLTAEQKTFFDKAYQKIKSNPDQIYTPHDIYAASIDLSQPTLFDSIKESVPPKFTFKRSVAVQAAPEEYFADAPVTKFG